MGICLALPVLVLATQNIIIGSLATLVIACITICVIGVIPLVGWKLGVLVSVNLCLVVGLSVDYVVHFAEAYHMSVYTDRLNRTRDMLETTGMSVVSGAITTLGASFFMYFGNTQFFFQFAAFIFSTIGFSFLFSIVFLSTFLALCGPENDTGSFKWLLNIICKNNKRKDSKVHASNGIVNERPTSQTVDEIFSTPNIMINTDGASYINSQLDTNESSSITKF